MSDLQMNGLHRPGASGTDADGVGGMVRRWTGSLMRRWQRRRMIAKLEAMDDDLLRDLGIQRGNIERLVDGFDRRELRMTPFNPATPATRTEHEEDRKAA